MQKCSWTWHAKPNCQPIMGFNKYHGPGWVVFQIDYWLTILAILQLKTGRKFFKSWLIGQILSLMLPQYQLVRYQSSWRCMDIFVIFGVMQLWEWRLSWGWWPWRWWWLCDCLMVGNHPVDGHCPRLGNCPRDCCRRIDGNPPSLVIFLWRVNILGIVLFLEMDVKESWSSRDNDDDSPRDGNCP